MWWVQSVQWPCILLHLCLIIVSDSLWEQMGRNQRWCLHCLCRWKRLQDKQSTPFHSSTVSQMVLTQVQALCREVWNCFLHQYWPCCPLLRTIPWSCAGHHHLSVLLEEKLSIRWKGNGRLGIQRRQEDCHFCWRSQCSTRSCHEGNWRKARNNQWTPLHIRGHATVLAPWSVAPSYCFPWLFGTCAIVNLSRQASLQHSRLHSSTRQRWGVGRQRREWWIM